MMAEVRRTLRSLFSPRRSKFAIVTIVAALTVFGIGILIAMTGDLRSLVRLEIGVLVVMVPFTTFRAIASERENRSLDFLTVSPVTPAQIISAKFLAALIPQATIIAISLLCNAYAALAAFDDSSARPDASYSIGSLFLAAGLLCLTAIFTTSLVLLISSRTKRAMTSLGVSIFAILLFFIGLPAFPNLFWPTDQTGIDVFMRFFSPFANVDLMPTTYMYLGYDDGLHGYEYWMLGAHFTTLIGASSLFLFLAAKSLPRSKNHGFFS